MTAPRPDAAETADLEAFRAARMAALTAPDGWLSVCGLLWLEPGEWSFGSAPDNYLMIEKLPAHAGTLVCGRTGAATVRLAPDAGGLVDGAAVEEAPLADDTDPARPPTRVSFGTVSFHLIDRGGRKALRVRDSDSAIRRNFTGIDYFPADPAWRIEARRVEVSPPRAFEIDSIVGIRSTIDVAHKAVFRHDGAEHELWPTHGTAAQPMFVIRDLTSGTETYGASRFLTGEVVSPDRVILDFNRAINPPCAFTPFATCPLPPPENRLPFAVTAGEKAPR